MPRTRQPRAPRPILPPRRRIRAPAQPEHRPLTSHVDHLRSARRATELPHHARRECERPGQEGRQNSRHPQGHRHRPRQRPGCRSGTRTAGEANRNRPPRSPTLTLAARAGFVRVLRPREDGCWQRMAARPTRAIRRAASALSGAQRAEGSGGRHVRALAWTCSSGCYARHGGVTESSRAGLRRARRRARCGIKGSHVSLVAEPALACRSGESPRSGDDLSPSRRPPLAVMRIRAGVRGGPVALF